MNVPRLYPLARPEPREPSRIECPASMIDRSEVLHVARLARLHLSDEEIEPMARELSAVLDHVARIGELDLDSVPAHDPRSRAHRSATCRRAARPCLPREVVLAQAPAVSGEGFLVPSPQA